MILTEELKAEIDSKTVYELLYAVRFASMGDEMMQGESGKYWSEKLKIAKEQYPNVYSSASKLIGWIR